MARPAEVIEKQVSRSAFDWIVTRCEQQRAVDALDSSRDPSADVGELDRDQMVGALVERKEPGGSGGDAVHLLAWVESNGRFIVLDSLVQPDEGGDRDFHAEWAILPSLTWHS
jgi:hypothetical protein